MPTERTEYKGHPLIVCKLDDEDPYPFQFGVGKAKRILENIDDIRQFVEENDGN